MQAEKKEQKKFWYHTKMTDEQKKMVEENMNLAYFFTAHFYKKYGFLDYYDVHSACFLGLVHSTILFNPEKSKFSTFSQIVMHSNIMMLLRHYNRHKVCKPASFYNENLTKRSRDGENFDIFNVVETSWHQDYYETIENEHLFQLMKILSGKEKLAIELYFFSDYSQREISEIMNLSQSYVSRIIERGIKKMREMNRIMMEN